MSNSAEGTRVPVAHTDLPVRQRALVTRLARSWAREEGELEAFDAESPLSPDRTGGAIFESYMSDAWDLLRGSGLTDILVLGEILARNAPRRQSDARDLDEIEGLIAHETISSGRIEGQLAQWRAGSLPGRDERWFQNAQRALHAKNTTLRAAHKLRLRMARDELMAEVVAGRDAQIRELLKQNRIEKDRRTLHIERSSAAMRAAREYVALHAPHLAEGLMMHMNGAEDEFDRARGRKVTAESRDANAEACLETVDIMP